jgi:hypothetical protein
MRAVFHQAFGRPIAPANAGNQAGIGQPLSFDPVRNTNALKHA